MLSGQRPSSAQLAELQSQIMAATTRGHRIDLKVGSGLVRRQADAIVWTGVQAASKPARGAS